jgi:hypothetical protein
MKTILRALPFLLLLSLIMHFAHAGERNTSPVTSKLASSIRHSIHFMSGGGMTSERFLQRLESARMNKQAHVCVCEILKMENNNDSYDQVALLSEVTDNGDLSSEYRSAGKHLDSERRRLKQLFFDVVKVSERVNAPVDCVSLYLTLAGKRSDLKMYDILDSDVLSARR